MCSLGLLGNKNLFLQPHSSNTQEGWSCRHQVNGHRSQRNALKPSSQLHWKSQVWGEIFAKRMNVHTDHRECLRNQDSILQRAKENDQKTKEAERKSLGFT